MEEGGSSSSSTVVVVVVVVRTVTWVGAWWLSRPLGTCVHDVYVLPAAATTTTTTAAAAAWSVVAVAASAVEGGKEERLERLCSYEMCGWWWWRCGVLVMYDVCVGGVVMGADSAGKGWSAPPPELFPCNLPVPTRELRGDTHKPPSGPPPTVTTGTLNPLLTKEAQEVYERALFYDSTNPDIYYNLGVVLLEQGRAQQALAYLDKALEMDPDHQQALLNSAVLIQESGNAELRPLAYQRLLRLVQRDPLNERIYFNLGMIAMDDRDYRNAEKWFRKLLRCEGAPKTDPCGVNKSNSIDPTIHYLGFLTHQFPSPPHPPSPLLAVIFLPHFTHLSPPSSPPTPPSSPPPTPPSSPPPTPPSSPPPTPPSSPPPTPPSSPPTPPSSPPTPPSSPPTPPSSPPTPPSSPPTPPSSPPTPPSSPPTPPSSPPPTPPSLPPPTPPSLPPPTPPSSPPTPPSSPPTPPSSSPPFPSPPQAIELKEDFRSALFNLALLLTDDQRPLEAAPFLNQLVKHHPDHVKGLILLGDIYINNIKDLDAAEKCYERILAVDPGNVQGLHNLCVVYVERGELTAAETCLSRAHVMAPHEDYILRHLKIVRTRLAKYSQMQQQQAGGGGGSERTATSALPDASDLSEVPSEVSQARPKKTVFITKNSDSSSKNIDKQVAQATGAAGKSDSSDSPS
ncbi:hypothetical protein Pcinc_037862 [Petrolisthes cinctipes]|uniref:Uncharacterized protein n=1 Tax=Petrolisthes cinctipes TaxID=88211 RepID=A0AAE1BS49_PETCI|nr:hypothetical protein Pcinc_037862 [Petrolisthes cinctipes]